MDFEIENGVLKRYNGNDTEVVIPDGVTGIGNDAFYNCTSLTSITIPDSVTSIGKYAFRGCKSLTSVTVPDSVTRIGKSAFENCTSLTNIIIPDSVTSIEREAFSGCDSLTSITIPDGVTSIGDGAFSDCSSLTSIIVPDGVTSIEKNAFWNCTSLKSITIPDSVTSIGDSAFWCCLSFTEIQVSEENTTYISCDGVLFSKDKTTLLCYPSGKAGTDYIIPNGVTSIGNSAFSYCSSLTSITIPDSVTSIGDGAFFDCLSLTSITIPDSVTSIGNSAFCYCPSLTSITIPDSVTSIGDSAFSDCTALQEVVNLSAVPILNETILSNSALQTGFFSNESLSEMDAGYKPFAVEMYLKQPEQYSEEKQAEYSKYIKSQGAKLLQKFIAEQKTESVAALLNTGAVTASAVSKGIDAAAGNAEITAVLLDYQNKHIDVKKEREKEEKKLYAALTHIETETEKSKRLFSYKKQEDGTLIITQYKGDETVVTVPEKIGKSTVTAIGNCAFSPYNSRCTNELTRKQITEIVLPNTITEIKDKAFSYCTSLTNITIPDGVTSIGGMTFSGCTSLTNITIPDSATSIGGMAFSFCSSLTSIAIPDSVISIGSGIFSDCTSLTEIQVSEGNEEYTSCEGVLFNKEKTELICYSSGKPETDYIIPDGVTSIGERAFSGCTSLTNITIPDSATSIGNMAFSFCSSLTSVIIPDSVTSIDDYAFSGCASLAEVVLPKDVSLGFDAIPSYIKVSYRL